MTALQDHLRDYLAVRRALGYKLERDGYELGRFVDELDTRGIAVITVDVAGLGNQIVARTALTPKAAGGDPRLREISGVDRRSG